MNTPARPTFPWSLLGGAAVGATVAMLVSATATPNTRPAQYATGTPAALPELRGLQRAVSKLERAVWSPPATGSDLDSGWEMAHAKEEIAALRAEVAALRDEVQFLRDPHQRNEFVRGSHLPVSAPVAGLAAQD